MTLTSKFDLNQTVYTLYTSVHREQSRCKLCKGKGVLKFVGVNRTARCPDCNGGGNVWSDSKSLTYQIYSGTVGRVTVEINAKMEERRYSNRRTEKYMLFETGIGTGSSWSLENLFATKAEAEAEGKKRQREYKEKL